MRVLRYDPSGWTSLGAPLPNAMNPSLVAGASGELAVAFTHVAASSAEVCVARWDGAAWVGYDGTAGGDCPSTGLGGSGGARVRLDGAGRPTVVWTATASGKSHVFLKRWNGAAWEELAGSGSGTGIDPVDGVVPSLAIDDLDRPIAAWRSSAGIQVRRWNGTSWDDLALPAPSPLDNYPEVGALGGERLIVAFWRPGGIYAFGWDAAGWTAIGTSADDGGVSGPGQVILPKVPARRR